ncbi:REX1 [Mytilus edulis]|uniref:REX1 n=2 Tax=Mytilus TaxID=6548 RepID=A0A8S3PZ81_MYTED|nr:REX1 [Mytilus edulis]
METCKISNMSKKDKRVESKKRKAKAFLQLANEVDEVTKQNEDSEDEDSKAKKSKLTEQNQTETKTMDDLVRFRKLLRDRQKASMEKPKVFLLLDELQMQHSRQVSQDLTFKEMPPLFLLDLQHLLLYAAQGNVSTYKPRWCRLLRVGKVTSVVVIVLDSVSSHEYQTYPDCFTRLNTLFDMSADMISPEQYGSTVSEDLFNVPISNREIRKINGVIPKQTKNLINKFTRPPGYSTDLQNKSSNNLPEMEKHNKNQELTRITKYTSSDASKTDSPETDMDKKLSNAAEMNMSHDQKQLASSFLNTGIGIDPGDLHENDSFSRTSLLLSLPQMILEDFPLPIYHGGYKKYAFSKDGYSTVSNQSPMFAIDCEMCVTTAKKYELTRVSVVNEKLEVVYDSFVKPYNPITDYVTRYSGVTKAILDPVKTRLKTVQRFLHKTLPVDAIVCGQSLKGDLAALKLFHPYVIDTSVIYNLSGHRSQKTSLRRLAAHFLGKDIQSSDQGHSSVEDAITTMELVQLKLKHSLNFGDVVNGGVLFPQKVEVKTEEKSASDGKKEVKTEEGKEEVKAEKKSTSEGKVDSALDSENIDQVEIKTEKCEDSKDKDTTKLEKGDKDSCSDGGESKNKMELKTSAGEESKKKMESDHSDEEISKNKMESEHCTCDETEADTLCKSCQAERKSGPDLIQQRKAFFQQAGSHLYESLFALIKKQNKMAGLIDKAETLEQFKDDTMTAVPTNCDRDTKSTGKSLVQFHDFVYLNFPSYKEMHDSNDEEEKMHLLRKQDKRMSKVLKHVRPNSLVAVVMTGRCCQGQDYSAKTFVKIT